MNIIRLAQDVMLKYEEMVSTTRLEIAQMGKGHTISIGEVCKPWTEGSFPIQATLL